MRSAGSRGKGRRVEPRVEVGGGKGWWMGRGSGTEGRVAFQSTTVTKPKYHRKSPSPWCSCERADSPSSGPQILRSLTKRVAAGSQVSVPFVFVFGFVFVVAHSSFCLSFPAKFSVHFHAHRPRLPARLPFVSVSVSHSPLSRSPICCPIR